METFEDIAEKIKDYSREQLAALVLEQKSTIDSLEQLLFFKRARKRGDDVFGTPLFDEAEQLLDENQEEQSNEIEVKPHIRRRGKRKPLPENLPRETIINDLPEEEKICPIHGATLVKIGETKTEKLEIIPAQVKVIEELTPTYKCQCCSQESDKENIKKANPIPTMIPKSFASASLLAYIVASKYQDSLPLYRLENAFQRFGIDLDRTTMARWMIKVGQAVQILINLMYDDLLERRVIGCDETPVQVLKEENRLPSQLSYMWVTISMIGEPIVLFQYHTSRGAKVLTSFLQGYQGTIVCDGLKSYDSFANNNDNIQLAACMAHIKRKFDQAHKALKKSSPKQTPRTQEILDLIRDLYKIENEIKVLPSDARLEQRQSRSAPLMTKIRAWLDSHQNKVLPKSLTGKAIAYANTQWEKMQVFLCDPDVCIDNNPTENAIRPFCIGRKNWLFSASTAGADASANLYSLVESAKANGIQPFQYLATVFKELPKVQHDLDLVSRFLPHNISRYYKIEPYEHPK